MTATLVFAAALAGIGLGWAACLVARRRQWNEAAGYFDEDRDDWRTWIEDHVRPRPRPVLFDGAMYPEDWEGTR